MPEVGALVKLSKNGDSEGVLADDNTGRGLVVKADLVITVGFEVACVGVCVNLGCVGRGLKLTAVCV